MVRQLLIESCEPDWGYVEPLATDHEAKLDEKGNRLPINALKGIWKWQLSL